MTPGRATLLPNIRKLFESRPWFDLEPDRDRTLVVAGGDGGGDPVPGARAAGGATAILYLPSRRTVTVDLSRISGREVRAWWFDPREGTARRGRPLLREGAQGLHASLGR